MKLPPLPPRWSYKAPFLKDDEGTERYVLNSNGKLDRLKVALILENHGHPEHAEAWRTGSETHGALAELLAAYEQHHGVTISGDTRLALAIFRARAALA